MKISDKALEDFKKQEIQQFDECTRACNISDHISQFIDWLNEMIECPKCKELMLPDEMFRGLVGCKTCHGKGKIPHYKTYEEE